MKRFSYLFLILGFVLLQGCRNGPTSANGNNTSGWIEATGQAPWTARYGLSGAVFNNNMWVIGGASGSNPSTVSGMINAGVTQFYGDVWKSSDGKSWIQTAQPGFQGLYGGQAVSFNGNLYFIGGNNNGTLMNDVWSSPDGVTWTQILADNPAIQSNVVGGTQFCAREDFSLVVFNNLMWVIGGTPNPSNTTSIGLNDVWNSHDGITWTQVLTNSPNITIATATTQPPARWGAAAVSFNGNFYLTCGHSSGMGLNTIDADIWSSPNGTVWTLVSNSFVNVYYHQVVVNNNAMWFTCGYAPWEGGPFNGVNSTDNGTSWTNAGTVLFPGRFGHLSLSFNNQVWIMGGCNNTDSLTYFNDVWHSP
ncbi:MAG TPA: hypothetical protein VN963_00695 [bacterium]|nr:hypothetical protein [bacterium]